VRTTAVDATGPGAEPPGWSTQVPPWLRRGVIFALVAVAAFQVAEWLFFNLRGFLGLLFLAWLFAITIEPVVNVLERRGTRRGLATGAVLFGLVALGVAFLAVFGALLVNQLAELLQALPGVVGDVIAWVNRSFGTTFRANDVVDSLQLTPDRIQQVVQQLTPGVIGIVSSLVGLVFQGFTLLLFAFYMSAEGPALRRTVASWFPPRQQRFIATVWEIAVDKTGGYVVSRLVLAVLSAFLTGVFLWLIGVPYWLPLAIWTGVVSQFIPTLGTYLAIAVPALIAMSRQPIDALWVVIFGVAYQQLENYFFAPRVTARTVSIHPAVAFGAVIVGAALFGPMGALVSIPVVAAIEAVVDTYGHRYELVPEYDEEELPARPQPPVTGDGVPSDGPPRVQVDAPSTPKDAGT
jgi:predicted PurR-regulated permease PerM